MRWTIGYIGVKDFFTLINLLGGVFGIYFAIAGQIDYAAYSIFIGYGLGDCLDGLVARLTKTGNRFGSEFDAATDHLAQAVAPAVIVFAAYTQAGWKWMGLFLMALIITTATLRQARGRVAQFRFRLAYNGLPRTISGLTVVAMPNATLFFQNWDYGLEGGVGVICLVALLNLAPVPYMSHNGRALQGYVKILALAFFAVPVILFVFARDFVLDFVFVLSFGYALTAWIPLYPDERKAYYDEYRIWSKKLNAQ